MFWRDSGRVGRDLRNLPKQASGFKIAQNAMNPNKITCSGRVLGGQAETSEIYQKPLASKTAAWGIKLLSGA